MKNSYTSCVLLRKTPQGNYTLKIEIGNPKMKITLPQKKLIAQDWTQTALEEKTGWPRKQISDVVRGRRRTPAIQDAIARAVGLSTRELFGRWAWNFRRKNGTKRSK